MSIRWPLVVALVAIPVLSTFAEEPKKGANPTAPADKTAPKAAEKPAITLSIGDKAPALVVEKWVKGQPVATFEKGKVYMIEFWATWCGPCIASMPHVTELQKKYRDAGLTVIGMTSKDSRGNSLEKVEAMVAEKGEGMGYTVAWDKERETNSAYMKAAGQGGIPCSFLVDQDGVVVYVGHPARIDATLELVMAKKHDVRALAAEAKRKKDVAEKSAPITKSLNEAVQAKNWADAVASIDKLVELDAEQFGGLLVRRFSILVSELKTPERAYADAKAFFAGAGKANWSVMNSIAWTIVDPNKPIERPDLAFALELANKANELTKGENAGVLDTLARVHFAKGDLSKAIEIATKAAAIDPAFQKQLDEYKAGGAKN